MAKKGPQYANCNEKQTSCTRVKAEPRKGCPNCEYTIQYGIFLKELEEELRKLKRGTRKGARKWPIKHLLQTVVEAASLAGSTEGIKDNWTVPVSLLVSVYRGEDAKITSAENYVPPTETPVGRPMLSDRED